MREVFAHPGYRRLWAARTVSQWGDSVNTVALALLVYDLTGSGLGVSAVVAAEILPVLLIAPLAGVLIDRLRRVRVMIAADLGRAAGLAVLALTYDHLVVVFVVAFATSIGTVFFNPAAHSVLPALVRKDQLVAANSGIWTGAVLSQIAIAPIAGFLVVTAGFGWAFAINAASYLLSAALLRGLRVPAVGGPPLPRRQLRRDALEGAQVLVRDRLLRAMAVVQLLAALSAGTTSALLVVYAQECLGATGPGYGALLAAIGVGAVLGPLVLLRLVREPRRPLFVFGPFALRGIVDLLLAVITRLPVAAGALLADGVGTSTGRSPSTACCRPRPTNACADGSSRPWICSGRPGGWPPSRSAARWPSSPTSAPSTSSVVSCSSSPPATASPSPGACRDDGRWLCKNTPDAGVGEAPIDRGGMRKVSLR